MLHIWQRSECITKDSCLEIKPASAGFFMPSNAPALPNHRPSRRMQLHTRGTRATSEKRRMRQPALRRRTNDADERRDHRFRIFHK